MPHLIQMNRTEDIIRAMLRLRRARRLAESPLMSPENVEILRNFIIETRRKIPAFALSHFDRIEASGKSGLSKVENGRCCGCGAKVSEDEIESMSKNRNIGVCDNCFGFLYADVPALDDSDSFFETLLIGDK